MNSIAPPVEQRLQRPLGSDALALHSRRAAAPGAPPAPRPLHGIALEPTSPLRNPLFLLPHALCGRNLGKQGSKDPKVAKGLPKAPKKHQILFRPIKERYLKTASHCISLPDADVGDGNLSTHSSATETAAALLQNHCFLAKSHIFNWFLLIPKKTLRE